MATNGSRKTAATSHALNVGAQMPISGENASPTPTRRAVQRRCFAVGPHRADERDADERAHRERAAPTTRATPPARAYSLSTSQRTEKTGRRVTSVSALGERKEHLFEIVGRGAAARRGQRATSSSSVPSPRIAPAAQQHEAVADARRVRDLVNRQEHRPARRRVASAASAATSRLWRRSRPSNGSSASSSGCGISRPIASSARLRCPFDRLPMVRVEQRLDVRAAPPPRRADPRGRRRSRA